MRKKTQDNSFLHLTTPLGPDVLVIDSLSGSEGLTQPFHFELSLLSERSDIAFDKIVGQRVSLRIDLVDGLPIHRYVNGFVSRFRQERSDTLYTYYSATVVPWIWFLSRSADCRIFQEQTALEIIQKVFKDRSMTDFEDKCSGSYPKLTYCVQYRERDIDFVHRLMEEFGITYYFRHEEERHILVLADAKSSHDKLPHQSKVRYKEDSHASSAADAGGLVTALQLEQEFHPGKFSHTDYNFEQPSSDLQSATPTQTKVGSNSSLEIYDYPGRYNDLGIGDQLGKIRMEEHEAIKHAAHGRSTCRDFAPGYCFDLSGHQREDLNTNYLLLQVWHSARAGEFNDGELAYTNTFAMIPSEVPFRPPQRTPKPYIRGPQTAVVVGPKGEEIYTDKYGRVKVQFHWDREGKRDQNSSCWVRVSQEWAGSGYGAICIPRIGQEVIVAFLEGDPDQPIISGRVYNASQMPPFALPGKKNVSGMKSNSTPGGGGANELHLDDTKGSESVYLHAQKDYTTLVENNMATTVKVDQTSTVQGKQTETITGDQTLTVQQGKQTITVETGAQAITVTSAEATLSAKTNRAVTVGDGPYSVTAKSDVTLTSQTATWNGLGEKNVTMKSNSADIFVLAPSGRAVVEAPTIEIKGSTKILLTVGGSSIEMTPGEIKLLSPKITSEAQGDHTIKGALVKLN